MDPELHRYQEALWIMWMRTEFFEQDPEYDFTTLDLDIDPIALPEFEGD